MNICGHQCESSRPGLAAEFRLLRQDELRRGHAILHEAFEWLRRSGIRQWTAPLSLEVYQQWQDRAGNYGLFVDGHLAVVLSLVEGPIDDWPGVTDCCRALWLQALATGDAMRGRGLGRVAVREALAIAESKSRDLYLLCVQGSGFLPAWYEALGFETLRRDVREYAPAGPFEMVLMRGRARGHQEPHRMG